MNDSITRGGERPRRVVALSGGVGGARFLHGLSRALSPAELTAIVNTGDDFEHWGLHISPDLDTVMYTLADLAHEERGWGLAVESFATLEGMKRLGAPTWFALGDRDLATHLVRTEALRRGEPLSSVTARLCRALGVEHTVLPMADGPCRTMIETVSDGVQTFQDWFVKLRTGPAVRAVRFEGDPPPAPGVLDALRAADLVVFGPSNPYVSIHPILTRAGVREALSGKPVVAISPIVGGQAVKGPLASMIRELEGREPTPSAVADQYGALLSAVVVERGDEGGVTSLPVLATSTVMKSRADSLRLAGEVLSFAEGLAR